MVVPVVGAAAVLWLLRPAGVDAPKNFSTILFAGFGVLALLAGSGPMPFVDTRPWA